MNKNVFSWHSFVFYVRGRDFIMAFFYIEQTPVPENQQFFKMKKWNDETKNEERQIPGFLPQRTSQIFRVQFAHSIKNKN